ncbi:MAG: hypothetical protein RR573_11530, partial [Oscillospiraceae bacterium]
MKKILSLFIVAIGVMFIGGINDVKAVYNGTGSPGGGATGMPCNPNGYCFYNNTANAYKLTFI